MADANAAVSARDDVNAAAAALGSTVRAKRTISTKLGEGLDVVFVELFIRQSHGDNGRHEQGCARAEAELSIVGAQGKRVDHGRRAIGKRGAQLFTLKRGHTSCVGPRTSVNGGHNGGCAIEHDVRT